MRFSSALTRVLPWIALLLLWEGAATSPRFHFLFAAPSTVAGSLARHTASGQLPWGAVITGAEAFLGFLIGVVLGTFTGFLFWLSPRAAAVGRPFVFLMGTLPIFAFAPMVIVWFGVGFAMKVAVAALGVFVVALSQALEGANAVGAEKLLLARLLSASRWKTLRLIVIPSALDWLFNSLRLGANAALLGAFIGEFISADAGIGYSMVRAGSLYDIPAVIAGGAYLVLLACLFHAAISLASRHRISLIRLIAL